MESLETSLRRLVGMTTLDGFLAALDDGGVKYEVVEQVNYLFDGMISLGEIYDDGYSDMVYLQVYLPQVMVVRNWAYEDDLLSYKRPKWTRKDQVKGEYNEAAVKLIASTLRRKF